MKLKIIKNSIFYFALFLFLSSCKKEERLGLTDETTKSKIAIVNVVTPNRPSSISASVGQIGYLLYMDNNLLYNAALIPNKTNGYILAEPGNRSIKIDSTEIGNNLTNPSFSVNTTNINAEAGKYYSVFYTGKVQSPDVVVTTDDFVRPSTGKASIRIINLSPDMPGVEIRAKLTTSSISPAPVLFPNILYKNNTGFTTIDAGFYSLELRDPGATTALGTFTQDNQILASFIPAGSNRSSFTINFESGKVYTLVVRGYKNNTISAVGQLSNPISVGTLINVYW